jgi:uncharacterized protein
MEMTDFESARQYVLRTLEEDLPSGIAYHSLAHTREDVVPAVERLAEMEGVADQDLLLLRTAAFFHDIGFVHKSEEHESAGAKMAGEVLPGFGYTQDQIETIQKMIMATHLPQAPHTLLEMIIADADLDVLGREDFLVRNRALRNELAGRGITFSDEQWYTSQLNFLKSHRYWTKAARKLRNKRKRGNIRMLHQLLAEVQQSVSLD